MVRLQYRLHCCCRGYCHRHVLRYKKIQLDMHDYITVFTHLSGREKGSYIRQIWMSFTRVKLNFFYHLSTREKRVFPTPLKDIRTTNAKHTDLCFCYINCLIYIINRTEKCCHLQTTWRQYQFLLELRTVEIVAVSSCLKRLYYNIFIPSKLKIITYFHTVDQKTQDHNHM